MSSGGLELLHGSLANLQPAGLLRRASMAIATTSRDQLCIGVRLQRAS